MNCQKLLNLIIKNKMCIDFETEKESFSEKRIKKLIVFLHWRIYQAWKHGSFHMPFSGQTDNICIITMILFSSTTLSLHNPQ